MEKSRKILITDTTLRDAHQSLWATRMKIDEILPILDEIDNAGYYSLECWGGATFDVCLRFLNENPWERLRQIKARCKTPLQMLLRGQNLLGYKAYHDDVLVRFIELAAQNGISIFRVFDALNDTRNLETAIRTVKKVGAHAQGTISYTFSPVHTTEAFVAAAKELQEFGADSICVKDMAGILTPAAARELVSALVSALDIPVQLHSHMMSGMAVSAYLEAVRAGAGAIDTCIASMSGCSSQPPLQTMRAILEAEGYTLDIDPDRVLKIQEHFAKIGAENHPVKPLDFVDAGVLRHHIPGGMISNLRSQLEQQDALDRLNEVLDEVPRVREDFGWPPLVTPTSQIVGVQSVLNVLSGKRYSQLTNESRAYLLGNYGRAPGKIAPELVAAVGGEASVKRAPESGGLAAAVASLPPKFAKTEENILSYALFPEVALAYFRGEVTPPPPPAKKSAAETQSAAKAQSAEKNEKSAANENCIISPLAGTLYTKEHTPGDKLRAGETICQVEAMKLYNPIPAPFDCEIVAFLVPHASAVAKGQPIVELKKL